MSAMSTLEFNENKSTHGSLFNEIIGCKFGTSVGDVVKQDKTNRTNYSGHQNLSHWLHLFIRMLFHEKPLGQTCTLGGVNEAWNFYKVQPSNLQKSWRTPSRPWAEWVAASAHHIEFKGGIWRDCPLHSGWTIPVQRVRQGCQCSHWPHTAHSTSSLQLQSAGPGS